jgi:mono/diheme cytochrome c family protein
MEAIDAFCGERVMPHARIARISLAASLAAALLVGGAALVSAQEGQATPTQRSAPIHHPDGAQLTDQQARGAALFFQRCSLCHLSKLGAGGSKYCCVSALGPNLGGRFGNIAPEQENAFRDIILNGGPTYMPAWKYGLTPDEVDDIIAYLKTLG